LLDRIEQKIIQGERINNEEALMLYQQSDLLQIGNLAHRLRLQKHPGNHVSYVVFRNINYTNICVSMCAFCAFSRKSDDTDAYVLSLDEICRKIKEAEEIGADAILLQGGMHPEFKIDFYVHMIRVIRQNFPYLHIHAFSPPEIVHISKLSDMTIDEVIKALLDAGLNSIPGGGAEILCDEVRGKLSPQKCTTADWLTVMETAHHRGLKTTATMMFGSIESLEDRIAHLSSIRQLQDKTHGFTAFIPWPFQPDVKNKEGRTSYSHLDAQETSAIDYLKMLALSRIYLDNFPHIEASLVTQGTKLAQIALSFGADDIGSLMIEENVVSAAGSSHLTTENEIIRIIQDAGFIPLRRTVLYEQRTD